MTLLEVLAAEFAEAWYRDDLASIVGGRSDAELVAWIGELCREHLEAEPTGARFAGKSVGATFGLDVGGRGVVLKLFPAAFTAEELRAFERCLAAALAAGYPAPRQLASFAGGAFYELVEGVVLDAHRPEVRRTLAEALARLVALELDPAGLPLAPTRADTLWGTPHRVTIDYARAGGAWIDERAAAAQAVVRAHELPVIAGHLDWGTKNALFAEERLVAILDWDSLGRASEAEVVGRAAAQFAAQWDFPAPLVPTPAEAEAFVREYEAARGRRLTPVERRVANAAADYLLATVARQELGGPHDELQRALRASATAPLVAASGSGG